MGRQLGAPLRQGAHGHERASQWVISPERQENQNVAKLKGASHGFLMYGFRQFSA